MRKKSCPMFEFMRAARGSWRNSIFVECDNEACERRTKCPGFLVAFGQDGQPFLMPDSAIEKITGEPIDKRECMMTISRRHFESLFSLWLAWEVDTQGQCVLAEYAGRFRCLR